MENTPLVGSERAIYSRPLQASWVRVWSLGGYLRGEILEAVSLEDGLKLLLRPGCSSEDEQSVGYFHVRSGARRHFTSQTVKSVVASYQYQGLPKSESYFSTYAAAGSSVSNAKLRTSLLTCLGYTTVKFSYGIHYQNLRR